MHEYKVVLKPQPETNEGVSGESLSVYFKADSFGVEVYADGSGAKNTVSAYIFTVDPDDEDSYTVGSVPFDNVRYVQQVS